MRRWITGFYIEIKLGLFGQWKVGLLPWRRMKIEVEYCNRVAQYAWKQGFFASLVMFDRDALQAFVVKNTTASVLDYSPLIAALFLSR